MINQIIDCLKKEAEENGKLVSIVSDVILKNRMPSDSLLNEKISLAMKDFVINDAGLKIDEFETSIFEELYAPSYSAITSAIYNNSKKSIKFVAKNVIINFCESLSEENILMYRDIYK